MISQKFYGLGIRLDAISYSVSKLDTGSHKALKTFRPHKPCPPDKPTLNLIENFLLKFDDKGDPTRTWREEGSILPDPNSPEYFEAILMWRFIFSLVARGTPNEKNRMSSKASLGGAMRAVEMSDLGINSFLAAFPNFHEEQLTNIVSRLASHNCPVRFDLTPIVYGMLYPEAEDLQEIRHYIARDFWIRKTQRQEPKTAKEVADSFVAG